MEDNMEMGERLNNLEGREERPATKLKEIITGIKIAEIISLLIATALAGVFLKKVRDGEGQSPTAYELGYFGRLDFFLFTTSCGMLIAMATSLPLAASLQKTLDYAQTMITINAIWALLLLASSALLTNTVKAMDLQLNVATTETVSPVPFRRLSFCDIFNEKRDAQCSVLIAAVVMGFFAMALFIVDLGFLICHIRNRTNADAAAVRNEEETANPP